MNPRERIDAYERLMRLHQPIGILLLLWPTLWALWLAAPGVLRVELLVIFLTGTVLMRSAGCIINDLADRNFDRHVERTRDRPLAAGIIQPREALVLAVILLALAFLLVLQLKALAIYLSFFGLAITLGYPYLKRFFVLPQAGLGIAFSFGVPMAYAAQAGRLPAEAWVLMAATLFWIMAYDTEYAMVDREDDLKLGLKSSAILFGRYDVAAVMLCHAAFIGIMTAVGMRQQLGLFHYAGLLIASGLVVHQYRLIKDRSREGCFRAFRHNNWVGAAIFVGIALDQMLGGHQFVVIAR
jgi:4-hydroxybenzoate polyprenyltransferase